MAAAKSVKKSTLNYLAALLWFFGGTLYFAHAAFGHVKSTTGVAMGALYIALGAVFAALGYQARKQGK